MKPNFALTLSFEGIGLLHRVFPGWHLVGEVALDTTDLTGELAALRGKALALDPSGLATKLVIPNNQIKFLDIDATGVSEADYADTARKALDGATPYAVDDLSFDYSAGSGRLYVAAVASETLIEAESFAAEHGFNPVSFVATPEATAFVGEPFFGETRFAAGHLDDGASVDRDPAAIRVIGAARLPEPEVLTDDGALPLTAAETPATDTPGSDTLVLDTSAAAPPQAAAPDTPDPEPAGLTVPPAPDPTDHSAPEPEPDTEDDTPRTDAPVAFASIRARRDDTPAAAPKLSGASRAPAPPPPPPAPPERAEPPAPAHIPSAEEPRAPAPIPLAPDLAETDHPAHPEDPAAPAHIPSAEQPRAPAPIPLDPDLAEAAEAARPEDQAKRVAPSLHADEHDHATADTEVDYAPLPEDGEDAVPGMPAAPSPGLAERVSFFTRRVKDRRVARDSRATAPDPRLPPPQDERQRMTVFGARQAVAPRSRPRFLALIMTAVLLLFLIGVAAWASLFLDEGLARFFRGPADDTRIASVPEDAVGEAPDLATAETDAQAEDIVIASLQPPAEDVETVPRTALPDAQPAELTADQARARYAATGIWQMAPDVPRAPTVTSLQEFYQTSIDPSVVTQDAIALPGPEAQLGDLPFDSPPDPPAAGTVFSFDERGFIRATPGGTLTPDGVLVIAGRPPLVPPAAALRDQADTPETEVAEAAAPETPTSRPRARPGDLVEQAERGQLAGRTRAELAAIRPRLRPKSAQEAAEEAAVAAAVAAAQAARETAAAEPEADPEPEAETETAEPDPFAGATAQAVAVSIKPKDRPRNFAAIVKKAEREAVATPVSAAQRVAPKIPTTASVARAATEKDRIKLRKVNLIGVYGKPSDRRALVRLANGRYKKVKVGDRIDGGKVSAIGSDELRYTKSGRSVVLKMPKG